MRRVLPSGKGASYLSVGTEISSGKRASQWEGSFLMGKSFPVGRELPSEKIAFQWEGSFLVGKELLSGKAELPSGKGAS